MGLFGAGLSYAALGDSAIWTASMSGGRGYYGSMTTLLWVRDTVMSGGKFGVQIFGGLGHSSSKATMVTFSDSGGAVATQQPNTGTRSIPPFATWLTAPTPQTWSTIVSVFDAVTPSTLTYVAPKSSSFTIEKAGALTFDRIYLGDWNISRVSPYPSSMPCKTTTLMAEFAIWRGKLTDADMAPLFAGANPLHVRPDILFAYYPLNGDLLDRGPRGKGMKGPSPQFGPHPPVEPIPIKHRISALRHVGVKAAVAATVTAANTSAIAAQKRSTAGKAQNASIATASAARIVRAAAIAASATSIKAVAVRKALGKSVSASLSTAKMAGPRASLAASNDGSTAAASATVARAASGRANAPSTAKAALKAARAASGASSSAASAYAAGGFVRSGAGAGASGSLAAMKMNVAYAVRGVSQAASVALAGITATYAATAKSATSQSVSAATAVASGTASRTASGAAATASRASAAASWSFMGSSASGSVAQAISTVRRPASGASATGAIVSAISTVTRAALGGSVSAATAVGSAGGPRASQGATIGISTASASATASRAAAAGTNSNSNASAFAGHGYAVSGASISGSTALAKAQGNMRGRSIGAAWATALALVTRNIRAKSISAGSAVATATLIPPQAGEFIPLLAATNIIPLRVFLSWRTAAFGIGADGSVGANQASFVDVGHQTEAIWTLLFDVLNAQASASSVQAALDYGFAQQAPDGSFTVPTGVGSRSDIESSFAFLFFACRAALLSQAAGAQYAVTVDPAKLAAAFAWYSANNQVAGLQVADRRSGSALMSAACAFLLGSLVLGDASLDTLGRSILAEALALQSAQGWFNERNGLGQEGFDAVYQGIAVHRFSVLCAYYPQETGWASSLRSAVTWLKSMIYPSVPSAGWLNVNGSVRSNGQDAPLVNGQPPQLDIADAGFGLLLAGQILNDAGATSLGLKVLALYDAQRSEHDVILRS